MLGMTLLEYAKGGKGMSALSRAYTLLFAMTTEVMRVVPFVTVEKGTYHFTQGVSLPSTGYRRLNQGFNKSTGVEREAFEQLVIAGGDMDVDRVLVKRHGPERRKREERKKVIAHAHQYTYDFFLGDSDTTDASFDGIAKRVAARIAADANDTCRVSAGGSGQALSLRDDLDKAIDQCEGANVLFLNKATRRCLTSAANAGLGGRINLTTDDFGHQYEMYGKLRLIEVDELGLNQNPLPLDGNGVCNAYVAALGEGKLFGIHDGPPDVRDLGELQSDPWYRTRVDWQCGLVWEHPRALVEINGIDTDEDFVA